MPIGTEKAFVSVDTPRHHFFGLTGTYYDKDLTDMVFRYDTLYAPKVGENVTPIHQTGDNRGIRTGTYESSSRWTENARAIVAADRPTYIPWLSKQHTFLVAQYTATWYPDMPGHSAQQHRKRLRQAAPLGRYGRSSRRPTGWSTDR